MATFKRVGKIAAGTREVPASKTAKQAKILSITCPATILANKRTDKLIGRDR